MDEREEYNSIFRKEVTLYEHTPPWRIFARTRRMGHVRRAAANLAYAGGNPVFPSPARANFVKALRDVWDWVWDWIITDWPGVLALAVTVIIAIIFGMIQLVGWMGTWGGPPKPLPQGIAQTGFTFIVSPGFAQRANWQDAADPGDLCDRIPGYGAYDNFKIKQRADGSILILCNPNKSS